jgi:hypothetical protein
VLHITVPLTVLPAPSPAVVTLASLRVDPSRVRGGEIASGTATLSATAPVGGIVITLTSSKRDAQVPAPITIAAGATSGTFTITTGRVSADSEILISAVGGGEARSAPLRLLPPAQPSTPTLTSLDPNVACRAAASTPR